MKALKAVIGAIYALDNFGIKHVMNGGSHYYDKFQHPIDDAIVSSSCSLSVVEPVRISDDDFDQTLLDPAQVTSEDFVKGVEDYVFQHQCLDHGLLDSINEGIYGDKTLEIVACFLSAYRGFTQNFCNFMEGCVLQMESKEHRSLLLENIDEENGIYENDDIQMMIHLGLDTETLQGVSHKRLFQQCIQRLREAAGLLGEDNSMNNAAISNSMVSAFNELCVDQETSTSESSIAAMYFGSELLVSNLYQQLIGFLRSDRRLSKQDLAFFILHIDMDVEHARLMRMVVLDHCNTRVKRENIIKAVKQVLDARVDFYDKFAQAFHFKRPKSASIGTWGVPKRVYAKRESLPKAVRLRCGSTTTPNGHEPTLNLRNDC